VPGEPDDVPRRNRIVAGMCRATVVTEAGIGSGALITAKQALDNGRDVFAVPGHADNMQAKGCHKLIKEGAGLIESFSDVLEAFGVGVGGYLPGFEPDGAGGNGVGYDPASSGDLSPDEQKILRCWSKAKKRSKSWPASPAGNRKTPRRPDESRNEELVEQRADQVYRPL
jgi:hypothetical protein